MTPFSLTSGKIKIKNRTLRVALRKAHKHIRKSYQRSLPAIISSTTLNNTEQTTTDPKTSKANCVGCKKNKTVRRHKYSVRRQRRTNK